jgi:hypothetical protein
MNLVDVKFVILLGAILVGPVFDRTLRRDDGRRVVRVEERRRLAIDCIRKFVSRFGPVGSDSTSEKYSLRSAVGFPGPDSET